MSDTKITRGRVMIVAAVLLIFFGCAYGRPLTYTEGGALLGTLYGAGLGAAIGSATGHAGEGAGIGALAGTLLGGVLGYGIENNGRYDYYYGDRYGYYDRYYGDRYGYDDRYYGDRYGYYDPYRDDPYYRAGRGAGPYSGHDPGYEYAPGGTVYPEDYYQRQNRRLMSPGYGAY
jgi:hypothetical protein